MIFDMSVLALGFDFNLLKIHITDDYLWTSSSYPDNTSQKYPDINFVKNPKLFL